MKVGVRTEIKTDEHSVALTPAGVRELTRQPCSEPFDALSAP
jgi:alanine dehydrogenase